MLVVVCAVPPEGLAHPPADTDSLQPPPPPNDTDKDDDDDLDNFNHPRQRRSLILQALVDNVQQQQPQQQQPCLFVSPLTLQIECPGFTAGVGITTRETKKALHLRLLQTVYGPPVHTLGLIQLFQTAWTDWVALGDSGRDPIGSYESGSTGTGSTVSTGSEGVDASTTPTATGSSSATNTGTGTKNQTPIPALIPACAPLLRVNRNHHHSHPNGTHHHQHHYQPANQNNSTQEDDDAISSVSSCFVQRPSRHVIGRVSYYCTDTCTPIFANLLDELVSDARLVEAVLDRIAGMDDDNNKEDATEASELTTPLTIRTYAPHRLDSCSATTPTAATTVSDGTATAASGVTTATTIRTYAPHRLDSCSATTPTAATTVSDGTATAASGVTTATTIRTYAPHRLDSCSTTPPTATFSSTTVTPNAIYMLPFHPGHHAATDCFGGYCYLNHAAALAARLSQSSSSSSSNENFNQTPPQNEQQQQQRRRRVVVLDVDYHCGNGTAAVFQADPHVLVISIHCDPDCEYPFHTGFAEDSSVPNSTLHLPLPTGTTWDSGYKQALQQGLDALIAFCPSAVIVSLGLDTYDQDPCAIRRAGFGLHGSDYIAMGHMLADAIGGTSTVTVPTIFVQEGGYRMDVIGTAAANVVCSFSRRYQEVHQKR